MDGLIVDCLDALASAATPEARWDRAAAMLERCGATWFTVGAAPRGDPSAAVMRTTAPAGFLDDYVAAGLHASDPFLPLCASGSPPAMVDVAEGLATGDTHGGRPLAGLFASRGIAHATLVPLYGGMRPGGLVLYAAAPDGARRLAMPEGHLEARMVSAIVGCHCRPEADGADWPTIRTTHPPLSPREREALTRLAAGHRTARIAEQMGVTAPTVEKHVAAARRKLRARTREQAVATAILGGVIAP